MAKDILETIKEAVLGVMNESSLCNVYFGTVLKTSPLEIQVEQKMKLTKEFLVLTKNAIDYSTNITLAGERKSITIHNALAVGDRVILIKQAGGQKFIVLDKVYKS